MNIITDEFNFENKSMKIFHGYPPNIDKIRKVFKIRPTTIFTFGDTIFVPKGKIEELSITRHEETHMKQQGDDPEGWWDRYLVDKQFRFNEELEAYRAQYREYIKKGRDRNQIFLFLRKIASDLSSSMYGNICKYEDAEKLIKS